MSAAIETQDLTVEFKSRRGTVRALDRVSLQVEEGAVFGFLGPNGAGKTTAMHALLGFLAPTSGKAFIFGTTGWNSFVRVAYGLNDVIGQYEMNDDYVYVDAYPNNFLYAESEPKSLRISIGIGSNFQ